MNGRSLAYVQAIFNVLSLLALLNGCSGRAPTIDKPDSGDESGGSAATGGNGAWSGGASSTSGGGDSAWSGGASSASGGGNPAGGNDAGVGFDLGQVIAQGPASTESTARPDFGALLVANAGERTYVVESRRDVETGPFGLPWRTRFRLAAYDSSKLAWVYPADPDDLIGDVVIHPSGEVTVPIEHQLPESMAYDLVRLTHDGALVSITKIGQPTTIPAADFASTDPQPLFRMKSDTADATTAGWLRLLANGEGLVAAVLSYAGSATEGGNRKAMGLVTYDWQNDGYVEHWARVVEGPHTAQPAAWAYDELRWMEQAVRPFLARDDSTGELLVGRAWNQSRCAANVRTFAEFAQADCTLSAVNPTENERLPLAVTRFSGQGERQGTIVIAPETDAAEQLPFALAAREGELAIVGSIVRMLPDSTKRTYPDANGFVDYDGYIAVYDAQGHRLQMRDFNFGRGDVFAALRWLPSGILAVGSVGWDRWQGGMSISKGADPCFAWLSNDGTTVTTRSITLSDGSRHFNLHDLAVVENGVVGYGFADAPMTHSGDGDNTAARTFGSLQIRLSP